MLGIWAKEHGTLRCERITTAQNIHVEARGKAGIDIYLASLAAGLQYCLLVSRNTLLSDRFAYSQTTGICFVH